MAKTELLSSFLLEVEAYAFACGLAPATVTSRAVSNSRLYSRLKDGGDASTETIERVRDFMAQNPPESRDGGKGDDLSQCPAA
jgi:hypothetical protein